MVRQTITRLVAAAGVTAAVAVLALGPGSAASAAPKPKAPATPSAVQLSGTGLSDPITVQKATAPHLYQTVYDEISWLGTAKASNLTPLTAKQLGKKFTIQVLIKNTPIQSFDLYPEAAGGPRAHRPAKQPGGRQSSDGWFYGRLSMASTLKAAGVPVNAKPDAISAGIGGGSGTDIKVSDSDLDPVSGVNHVLDQMRRLFLLNGAVLVVILFGLAGIAFLIRRRI